MFLMWLFFTLKSIASIYLDVIFTCINLSSGIINSIFDSFWGARNEDDILDN